MRYYVSMKPRLAPYAIPYATTLGRVHAEIHDATRTPFQRDRDRIIHSKAFRRLSGKTQVFVATYADHYRDRLTHSLEVAQVARDIARSLGLNEDVVEAVGLAHDLGHPPFGHAGQDTLNELMAEFGDHFEHNEQSKRVVEVLEHAFPNFEGLNLTREVLDGLAKHQTLYDQKTKKMIGKTLEAEVVDLADEIAYHSHDIEDGLRAKLFTVDDLSQLSVVARAREHVEKKYGKGVENYFLKRRLVSQNMSLMIADVIHQSEINLTRHSIKTLKDVIAEPQSLVQFSAAFDRDLAQLRTFLMERMYSSPKVLRLSHRGQSILKKLFRHFLKHPDKLPKAYRQRIDRIDPLHVVVKDYVAGMTDEFATNLIA